MKPILTLFLFAALLACKPDPAPADAAPTKDTALASAHGDTAMTPGTDTAASAPLIPTCGELEKDIVPPIALRYARLAQDIREGRSKESLESLWKVGDSARGEIECHLFQYSDTVYQQLQTLLTLEDITREEQVFSEPSIEKYQELARLRGTPEDTMFLHLMSKWFYRTNAWIWNQQDCDACWCDRIGDSAVVDGYLAFEGYLKGHANRYGWFIRPRLRDLDTTFSRSHEACRSRAEETKGLKASRKRLPANHPLRLAIDTLLVKIGKKDPAITFDHEPGSQKE